MNLLTRRPLAVTGIVLAAVLLASCSNGGADPNATASASEPAPTTEATTTSPGFDSDVPVFTGGPDFTGTRAAEIDDVDALALMANPQTGETWHLPTPIVLTAPPMTGADMVYFEIGSRGEHRIIAAIWPYPQNYYDLGNQIAGVFETDASGFRAIVCPSRREGDACLPPWDYYLSPTVSIDNNTYYDSFTFPETTVLDSGASVVYAVAFSPYGNGDLMTDNLNADDAKSFGLDHITVEATLGTSGFSVLRLDWESEIPGVNAFWYAIQTPFFAIIPLRTQSEPGLGEPIEWDDGLDTFTHADQYNSSQFVHFTAGPIASTCSLARAGDTLDSGHVTTDWIAAGHTAAGARVFVPVDGGNAIAATIWSYMSEHSMTAGEYEEGTPGYAYPDYTSFLEARSVFTWQRGDGQWVIAMDPYARNTVYECS